MIKRQWTSLNLLFSIRYRQLSTFLISTNVSHTFQTVRLKNILNFLIEEIGMLEEIICRTQFINDRILQVYFLFSLFGSLLHTEKD